MNAFTIAQIKKVKPLSQEEYDLICDKGTVTGSFVFGGHDGYISDVDYIIENDYIDFNELLSAGKVYENDTGSWDENSQHFQFYCRTQDNLFLNILVFGNPSEFKRWRKATQLMVKMKQIKWLAKQFKDKNKRVKMFCLLRDNFT